MKPTSFDLDPRVKLLLLIIVSWLALYIPDTGDLLVLTGISLLIPLWSAMRLGELLRSILVMATIILTFSLIGAILDPRLPWWQLGPLHISQPGIITSLLTSWRVIIILWWAFWFTGSTSVRQLTMTLEWILLPLSKRGIKVSGLVLGIVVALRFIPELLAEGRLIREAQQLRGYRDKPKQTIAAAHSLLAIIVPLLTRTWLRAEEMADAILARGYRPGIAPVRLYPLTLTRYDLLILTGVAGLVVWIVL